MAFDQSSRKIHYGGGDEMTSDTVAPYGLWESPISAADVADIGMGSFLPLAELKVNRKHVYWIERRADESGRQVIVQLQEDGSVVDRIPPGFNARTCVHEYGGGSYCVHNQTVFFSNYEDQKVYRAEPGIDPIAITPAPSGGESIRYADAVPAPDGRWLIAVAEEHKSDGRVLNSLVAIPTDGNMTPQIVASGNDFYSTPKFSSDGKQLAWLTWNHPQMPWNGTELWLGVVEEDFTLTDVRKIAGDSNTSIFQPEWSRSGRLYFVSDISGWWNLHAFENDHVEHILPQELEIGYPQWIFGLYCYTILSDGNIALIYSKDGVNQLALLDPIGRFFRPLSIPYNSFTPPYLQCDEGDKLWVLAGNAFETPSLIRIDPATARTKVVRRAKGTQYDVDEISPPVSIKYPTFDGYTAHAFFYEPKNPSFQPREGELPPLIVKTHGGPTSAARCHLQLEIQYWTSRGFAVVDVNYGGSTGFGKDYRMRLEGNWGIVDTKDCISASTYLVEKGLVDGDRLLIRGGSAGGFTTLSALTFHEDFAAGASYYGVPDLKAMAQLTHKFEAHYLDQLLAPLPEGDEIYFERSPIHHTHRLSKPMIIFQGLEDKVVLPAQAELMVNALDEKGLPYAYIVFEDEAHGFRKKENVIRSLEAEYAFYLQIFGMKSKEMGDELKIHNLT